MTKVRNLDTCVYISENKCTSPLKIMYGYFFFEIYIKFPTFWYPKLLKRANRKQSKYYQKKKRQIKDFLPNERARPGKKSFFHLFPKILNIVLSTSTRSQNDGKYLYFTRMKIFFAEKYFFFRLRTFLCDESS